MILNIALSHMNDKKLCFLKQISHNYFFKSNKYTKVLLYSFQEEVKHVSKTMFLCIKNPN